MYLFNQFAAGKVVSALGLKERQEMKEKTNILGGTRNPIINWEKKRISSTPIQKTLDEYEPENLSGIEEKKLCLFGTVSIIALPNFLKL